MKGRMKGKILIGVVVLFASCLDNSLVSTGEQLRKDVAKIDQYLAEQGMMNVISDGSGVRLLIDNLGTGLAPNYDNELKIQYELRLLDGTFIQEGTFVRGLGESIFGWQICLPMLPAGTEATLFIPSVYGYGAQGTNEIPKNANLIFKVFLEEVLLTDAQEAKLASDATLINNYLIAQNIDANPNDDDIVKKHASGLRYEIIEEGDGITPGLFDQIEVNFTGRLISDNSVFATGTVKPDASFSSRLCNFLNGWQVGLPLIREGGKIRLFIPSTLGYGTRASGSIRANSNLYFELELVKIE